MKSFKPLAENLLSILKKKMRQKYIFKSSHSLTRGEYRFKELIWIFFSLYASPFVFRS